MVKPPQFAGFPGRGIIIGTSAGHQVAAYFITGRTPASRMRRLEIAPDGSVDVCFADKQHSVSDYREKILHPAILFHPGGIVVGSGVHAGAVATSLARAVDPFESVHNVHSQLFSESGAANPASRISGAISGGRAVMGVTWFPKAGGRQSECFELKLAEGSGYLVTTHAGMGKNPVAAFQGPPVRLKISASTADEYAREIYDALPPSRRVGVAVVFRDPAGGQDRIATINRVP